MTRRYDPRRARSHLSYSRAELSELFRVGLATICAWKREGLQPIDNRRPYLFAGAAVRNFLEKHNKPRQRLASGEIYCVACKRPICPQGNKVDFCPLAPTTGDLIGTCPHCLRRPRRRVRKAEILEKAGNLEVRFEDGSVAFSGDGNPARTELFEGQRS